MKFLVVFFICLTAYAEEVPELEVDLSQSFRLVQEDKYGNKLEHLGSLRKEGKYLIQTDKYGNKLYHLPRYEIEEKRR